MKKTITLPDGTVEVLEGTPEEIAAHEKLIRERTEKKRKPDVLKGVEVTGTEPVKLDPEVVRKLQELIEATKENRPVRPWYEMLPYSPPTCWYCGKQGCTQIHENPWAPQFIYAATSDRTCDGPIDVQFIPERDGGLIVS